MILDEFRLYDTVQFKNVLYYLFLCGTSTRIIQMCTNTSVLQCTCKSILYCIIYSTVTD